MSGDWFSKIYNDEYSENQGVRLKFDLKKVSVSYKKTDDTTVNFIADYNIDKNGLIIFTIEDKDKNKKELKYKIIEPVSPIFKQAMVLDNEEEMYYKFHYFQDFRRIWDYNSKITSDKEIIYNKLNIITTDKKIGETITQLKIREFPDVKSRSYFLVSGSDILKSLPKGSKLRIYARTKEKIKIGEWSNYWYYVKPIIQKNSSLIYEDDEMAIDDQWVDFWAYGEFIKF